MAVVLAIVAAGGFIIVNVEARQNTDPDDIPCTNAAFHDPNLDVNCDGKLTDREISNWFKNQSIVDTGVLDILRNYQNETGNSTDVAAISNK